MPLFDFRCRGCKHEFEVLVMGATILKCPACGSEKLDKLPARFGMPGSASSKKSPSGSSSCGSCRASSCATCRS